ncbi:hypothetical protein SAMN02910292_02490 [Lachnospiraceae bacterium XBB2008]|nr:hypothetical protein SAMN02910292_02490 [Lachnospiraceae bacterium XBB2008]
MKSLAKSILLILICVSLIGCGAKDPVAERMIQDIDSIGEVSFDDKEKIEQLFERYSVLTDKQKEQVTNYVVLLDAMDEMNSLEDFEELLAPTRPVVQKVLLNEGGLCEHFIVYYDGMSYEIIRYNGEGTPDDEMHDTMYDTRNGDIVNSDGIARTRRIQFEDELLNGYSKDPGEVVTENGRAVYYADGTVARFTIRFDLGIGVSTLTDGHLTDC